MAIALAAMLVGNLVYLQVSDIRKFPERFLGNLRTVLQLQWNSQRQCAYWRFASWNGGLASG